MIGDQTLAQRVRAKYPGTYDDLTDQQLEAAVIAKFPGVYDDIPKTPAQSTPIATTQAKEPQSALARARQTGEMPRGAGFDALMGEIAQREEARRGRNVDLLPLAAATGGGLVGGPIGAAIGGAGGEAIRQVDRRLSGRSAPGTMREAAQDIGVEGAVQGTLEAAGGLLTKAISKGATAVYRGYLKPSLAGAEIAKAREIVDTAIRERLPISQAGETRGKLLISKINNEVNTALKNASVGKSVDLHAIAEKIRTFAKNVYNKPGAPPEDLAAALRVADEIDQHASLGLTPGAKPTRVSVTPEKANQTKQALDKAIGDTGFGVERGAATEARKVGRHAARKAIEEVVPAVKALNKRESEVIDALESVTKAVGRESNKDAFLGMRTLASAGLAGSSMGIGNDPSSALVQAAALRVGLSPNLMSRAAILASRFSKVPGTGAVLAARMGLILALRESEEQPSDDRE